MSASRRRRRGPLATGLALAVTLVLAPLLWFTLAPASVGGAFSYVFVQGNSMEPAYSANDIVLLRGSEHYAIGDVVAYRHPQLGTVLHRIIEFSDGRFTTRGDTRADADTHRPDHNEILGRSWVTLPNAAGVVRELQSPRNAVLLAVGSLALGAAGRSSKRLRGRPRRGAPPRAPSGGRGGGTLTRLSAFSPTGAGIAGVAVALLAAAVAVPLLVGDATTREVTETITYRERGAFSYGGPLEGGVYDANRLSAPEPLFRRLSNELAVSFDYALVAGGPALTFDEVRGSLQLHAEVHSPTGWKRTLPLEVTTFDADRGSITGVVRLTRVDALVAAVERTTEVESPAYALRIVARAQAAGRFAGEPFATGHEQGIEFSLSELALQFDAGASLLEDGEESTLERTLLEPRAFALPMLPIEVPHAWIDPLALTLGVLAAVALLPVALASLVVARRGEAARIEARYGEGLIGLDAGEPPAERTLEVSGFADLARLATRAGTPILHRRTEARDEYFVVEGTLAYRYARSHAREPGDTPGFLTPPRATERPPAETPPPERVPLRVRPLLRRSRPARPRGAHPDSARAGAFAGIPVSPLPTTERPAAAGLATTLELPASVLPPGSRAAGAALAPRAPEAA